MTQTLISPRTPTDDDAVLTPREHEVLTQVAAGLNNAEIADRLFVSSATVKNHVANILATSCPLPDPWRGPAGPPRAGATDVSRHHAAWCNGVMSEPATAKDRPPQVTMAAWLIMVGSVFVVLMVWDRIAGLHSLESRKSLLSMLDQPGIKGSGLGLSDLMTIVRVLSMVAAGCATAMAVLGYQALQRSRSARSALTVLAVPLFLTGLVTGGFVAAAVAAAVATLWLGPSRLWFRGELPASSVARGGLDAARRPEQPTRAPEQPARSPEAPSPGQPAAPSDLREQPPAYGEWPQAWATPATSAYGSHPVTSTAQTSSRPAALLWAAVLTWVFTSLSTIVLAGSMIVLANDSRVVLDKMHAQNPDLASQGISDHTILVLCYVMCTAFIAWAVVAAVLAALAFRRVRWAWYALVVSTIGVIGICVLGSLGSLLLLVPLAAAAAAISMLVRPEVRRWFGQH
jgi:hypothetical protein